MSDVLPHVHRQDVYGHLVASALGHDEVGMALARLDELLVHGLEDADIPVHHRLGGASPLQHVALDDADEALVRVGVHKDLEVHHAAQGGVVEGHDAFDDDHLARLDVQRLRQPRAGDVVVRGLFDGNVLPKGCQMLAEQRPIKSIGMVEVDALPPLHGDVAAILVIRILGQQHDFARGQALDDFPHDGGLSRPGAAGNSYYQHNSVRLVENRDKDTVFRANLPYFPDKITIFAPMIQIETILDLLWKGFIIGVIVSAPLGPVGVLCIQRTLNKGRWYGLVTGMGAALSDICYALLTGYGMSFVFDYVNKNIFYLQLFGSILLLFFGVYTFRSNPVRSLRPPSGNKGTYLHNFVTAFFVTLSNPLIIFLFVGLFARFSFVGNGALVSETVTGYLSIIAGALTWWFGITYFINKVRTRFNLRGIWMLNRIIGSIVVVVSLLGLAFTLMGESLY